MISDCSCYGSADAFQNQMFTVPIELSPGAEQPQILQY